MNAYYNENDPFAAAWLRNLIATGLISPGFVDERDIQDVQPADLAGYDRHHFFAGIGGWDYALRLAGWPDDRPIWTGSCPCQPFSAAGKRGGLADTRHLWPTWFRLIRECQPPVVFGEQVASKDGRAWLDHVGSDLEADSYAFGAVIVGAAAAGTPHLRRRLWFVADSDALRRERASVGSATSHSQWNVATCRQERRAVMREAGPGMQSPWPVGPGRVGEIPRMVDGLSSSMEERNAYGNAIVPQVAAEFVMAFLECARPLGERAEVTR